MAALVLTGESADWSRAAALTMAVVGAVFGANALTLLGRPRRAAWWGLGLNAALFAAVLVWHLCAPSPPIGAYRSW